MCLDFAIHNLVFLDLPRNEPRGFCAAPNPTNMRPAAYLPGSHRTPSSHLVVAELVIALYWFLGIILMFWLFFLFLAMDEL